MGSHIMLSDIVLMSMLVVVFVMAGAQHLLVFLRNPGAVEHLWFGATSLAAAGAGAAYCAMSREMSVSGSFVTHYLPMCFAAAWLITATWFSVVCAAGDSTRRQIALLAVLLTAIACAGALGSAMNGRVAFPASAPDPWRPLSLVALAIMLCLVIEAGLRLWSSARRVRAAALGGVVIALFLVAVQLALQGRGFPELPPPALYAFGIVVLLMAYELAGAVADEAVTRRQQQELAHASRLSIVGELTASLAHEINQPLGAILSNADAGEILLEDRDPPLDEIRQILADIRRDGLRASDVIRHVRKLVRKRELELEELDANAVATEVIALLEPEAHRRRIVIALTLCAQPVHVRGDRALMEQVLINLLMNAMDAVETVSAGDDASSARSSIILGVSMTNHGEIEFQIVDAGAGIPAERLEHLFDSFYTSKAHGMGLGLSIARSIIESHGGRIGAENNRDAGATFRVTLPPIDEAGDQLP